MLQTDYNLPVKLVSETSFTKYADTSGPKFAWFAYLKNISMMIPTVYTKVSIEKYLGGDLENYDNLDPIYPFDYIHK